MGGFFGNTVGKHIGMTEGGLDRRGGACAYRISNPKRLSRFPQIAFSLFYPAPLSVV